jgi:hypothetical protein
VVVLRKHNQDEPPADSKNPLVDRLHKLLVQALTLFDGDQQFFALRQIKRLALKQLDLAQFKPLFGVTWLQ